MDVSAILSADSPEVIKWTQKALTFISLLFLCHICSTSLCYFQSGSASSGCADQFITRPADSSHSPLVPSSFLPLQLDSPWQLNQAQTRRPSRRRTRRRRRRRPKQLILRRLRTSQCSFLWPPDTAPLSGRNRSEFQPAADTRARNEIVFHHLFY